MKEESVIDLVVADRRHLFPLLFLEGVQPYPINHYSVFFSHFLIDIIVMQSIVQLEVCKTDKL